MYSIGLSTMKKKISEELFHDCKSHDISMIELSEPQYDGFDFDKIARLAEKCGVTLWSLHLPFYDSNNRFYDPSSLDESERNRALQVDFDLIKKASQYGIKYFILHPSGEPVEEDTRAAHLKQAKQSLKELAAFAADYDAVICVEDLPRSCLGHNTAEMKELLSADDRLCFCFDTNHIQTEEPEDIVRALGNKLVTLHVSDFDEINERHWLPGEGRIHWPAFLKALKDVNYQGPFLYEIAFECPNTIHRRELTCQDFAENAKALFQGTVPPLFSTPKENLGMWE